MPKSETALATKGKRIFDRATKDLGGKEWLHLHDYQRILQTVSAEFADEPETTLDDPLITNSPTDSDCNETQPNDPAYQSKPLTKRPTCIEYTLLLERGKKLLNNLKSSPIEQQMRKSLKKKRFSQKILDWADWIAFDLMSGLGEVERGDITCINTVIYVVAAIFSMKEGQECGGNIPTRAKKIEPRWKQRL